ncbi:MAG: glycosyltransferase [Spirochaetales bacterium]|nr:glycosyltransferase [Spirochaetales bacterium]
MTIVHIIEPFASGVTTAVISIVQQLRKEKHIVVHGSRTWVDTRENVKKKFPPGVDFIPWKYAGREINPVKDLLALLSLISILRRLKSSFCSAGPEWVVHLHSSKAGFLGRLACRLLGIRRVIYTPHGASFIRRDISRTKQEVFRLLEKLGGRFSGLVVGCGESEAALYRGLGRPALWVANGVAIDEPLRDEGSSPQKNSPKAAGAQICFVGIANRQKNPALFNDIAQSCLEDPDPRLNQAEFLWVGDGALKDRLAAGNIRRTGWVDGDRVQACLNESLIYLSTSGWEGLPYGVLEAMKASCALLLTDVPGNRDLVRPGINGFLFTTPGEGLNFLRQLLDNREKTLALGRESRRIVEDHFNLKQMGEGYWRIYRALVDDAGKNPGKTLA